LWSEQLQINERFLSNFQIKYIFENLIGSSSHSQESV
jgi:hypothetical protein